MDNWHCHQSNCVTARQMNFTRHVSPRARIVGRDVIARLSNASRFFTPAGWCTLANFSRAGRLVKSNIRTTGMNSNGISPPVDWFARRNVIFITSVAAKFPRKFQILYILHERVARGRIYREKSGVKAGTIDGCENDVNIPDKNITQREWCARTNVIYFFFL